MIGSKEQKFKTKNISFEEITLHGMTKINESDGTEVPKLEEICQLMCMYGPASLRNMVKQMSGLNYCFLKYKEDFVSSLKVDRL